jgi:PST family polysaccharide transporter
MKPKLPRLVRDYAALSAGEFLSKIAGFVAFAYLARVLAPEGYGAVEFAVALTMVGALIVDFGLGPIGAREITEHPDRARGLVASISAARLALAGVALPFVAITAYAVADPGPARGVALLYAVALLGVPWTLNWLFQGLDLMPWVAPAQLLRMGVFALGAVLLVRGPDQLLQVGWIEIASVGTMAAYFVIVATYHGKGASPAFRHAPIRRLLREAAPIGGSQLLWSLNQYLPTAAVALLLGAAPVGYYGAAHRVLMALGSFVWLYFFSLYPSLVRATRDAGAFRAITDQSFRLAAWIGILLAMVLGLLATPLCRLVYGEAFGDSGLPLAVLVWALPVGLLSGHARFSLIGSGNQWREMLSQAGGVLVTLAFAVGLIPVWGLVGAALSVVASAVTVWALAHHAARAVLPPLPGLRSLWRPAVTAIVALSAALALPLESPALRASLAATVYVVAGGLVEPRLLGDLRGLVAG